MSDQSFDVFLSHNSRDKPAVRDLKQHLLGYKITVWLDEDELQPGIPWQDRLEHGIRNSTSVAVLIGKDGLGPWEDEEMQSALKLAVMDKRPVIPVLLPESPSQPELPLFLANRTWVDIRSGFTVEGLEKLVWGITSKKPDRPRPTKKRAVAESLDKESEWLTLTEVATRLHTTTDHVRDLVQKGDLTAKKFGGEWRLDPNFVDGVVRCQAGDVVPAEAAIGRREMIKMGVAGAAGSAGAVLAISLAHEFKDALEIADDYSRPTDEDACKLFAEIFGLDENVLQNHGLKISLGRRAQQTGYHPDNFAACRRLMGALGWDPSVDNVEVVDDLDLLIARGDLLLFGGPNSTPYTSAVFEFKAVDGAPNRLQRPEDRGATPILPLKYYGQSDPELVREKIAWKREHVGPVPGINWGFWQVENGRGLHLWKPTPSGKPLRVRGGERLPTPVDDYLLLTRLPNILHPHLEREINAAPTDPRRWPHMLICDGAHGIGTRALELLLQADAVPKLENVKEKLRGASEFQVLFKMGDVRDCGIHRANVIEEVIDAFPLRERIADGTAYLAAQKAASARVTWPPWLKW